MTLLFLLVANNMKKIITTFILSLLAFYANAEKPILLLGAGGRTCNQYIEDLIKTNNETNELLYSTWVQGYICGRNSQLELMKYKAVNLDPTIKISSMLQKYCLDTKNIGSGDVLLVTIADVIFKKEFEQKNK